MKRLVVMVILLPVVVLAVDLTTYETDRSQYQVISTGLNYQLNITEGQVNSHIGKLSLNFERFQTTPSWSYALNFFGNITGNFETDTAGTDTTDIFDYLIQWDAKYNLFFGSGNDFFGFGKLEGEALTAYDYPATRAIIGVGYGRFTAATPLARAVRIQDEMLEQGVLLDILPHGPLMSFANELSPEVMQEYKDKYYYWEREYYKGLERILNESGLLASSQLGSAGSLIVSDVLDEYISPRYHGYEINLGVGYDLFPAYEADGRSAFASLNFEYARPIAVRSQFVGKTNLRLPFTEGKFGKEIHGGLFLSMLYEVGSTLDLIGSYKLNIDRTRTGPGNQYSVEINNRITGTFDYLIVDHLVMSNTVSINHSSRTDLSADVSSTINYRFF